MIPPTVLAGVSYVHDEVHGDVDVVHHLGLVRVQIHFGAVECGIKTMIRVEPLRYEDLLGMSKCAVREDVDRTLDR